MIAWFTRNGVAANLMMAIIIVGGLLSLTVVKKELFPLFTLDLISVRVLYLGAAPEEVERGICMRIEEKIQDLEGIKKMTSIAAEGYGNVMVEVEAGYDVGKLKEDIKTRVDSIDTFPNDSERPIVEEVLVDRDVLLVAVAGDADERTLKRLSEKVRDDLVAIPGITQVSIGGLRDFEISIDVSENTLRKYGLTFNEVVAAVQKTSLDVPGGSIKADGGEILLRTISQAYVKNDFEELVLRTNPDGTRLLLKEIATIRDGFTDTERSTRFNGMPASLIRVSEVGKQNPLDISEKVREYIESSK
ncbi:MAG: efflux RND transporter permease subunit, partial [Pseudomonadota bacterium]